MSINIGILDKPVQDIYIDCIVNSANTRLKHGSGIALELAKAAGPKFVASCRLLLESRGEVPLLLGSAHLTVAGNLANHGVKGIINAVAMGYSNGRIILATEETLRGAVHMTLREADAAKFNSIIFPVMCARHGGLSATDSIAWIVDTCFQYVKNNHNSNLKSIMFNAYGNHNYESIWQETIAKHEIILKN